MQIEKLLTLDIPEEEIRLNFRLLTGRPISERSVSVGKCIAKTAQRRVVDLLKSGLIPLRENSNYYLIEAEVVNELLKKLGMGAIIEREPDKI
jgi:hypothetical protein